MPAADAGGLRRCGFRLEYATMTWMAAEAAVAITAGLLATSIALVGFGLDSVIELISATIVIWQLRGEITGQDRQTHAIRLIGMTFFALATYLTIDSIRDLATQAALSVHPRPGGDRRRADRHASTGHRQTPHRAAAGQPHLDRRLRRDRLLRPHLPPR